jgi:hypothetical protein
MVMMAVLVMGTAVITAMGIMNITDIINRIG